MAFCVNAYCLFTCGVFLVTCLSRFSFVLFKIRKKRKDAEFINERRKSDSKTMVVMGSDESQAAILNHLLMVSDTDPQMVQPHLKRWGKSADSGHTTEMLRLLSGLSDNYSPRDYVMAVTDVMSEKKVHEFELKRKQDGCKVQYSLTKIPRSREVKQSYVTSVLTTIHACLYSLPLVFSSMPDLVLTNGPGTCIPICLTAFLIKFLGLKNITIVYIESICRVESLSLSAKLLYHIADYLLVQWPELQKRYPLTSHIGRTV